MQFFGHQYWMSIWKNTEKSCLINNLSDSMKLEPKWGTIKAAFSLLIMVQIFTLKIKISPIHW